MTRTDAIVAGSSRTGRANGTATETAVENATVDHSYHCPPSSLDLDLDLDLDDYVVTRVVTTAVTEATAAASVTAAGPSPHGAITDCGGSGGGSASGDRALVSSKEGDGSVASGKRSSRSNNTRSAGHDNAADAASRLRGLSLGGDDEDGVIDDDEVSEYLQSLHGAGGAGGVGQNQVVHPREGLNPFTTTLIVINYMSVGYLLVPGGTCA
jgi:hypothetical protein